MSSVVFLRGVNVGGANLCKPAELAKQLKKFDIVNIGAVGTFVAGYATQPYAQWNLTSGSLTPSVVTPEPSSVVLTLSGIGFVFLLVLKRKGLAQNHQQAT